MTQHTKKIANFENDGRILKIKESHYLQKRLADFDAILHDTYLAFRPHVLLKYSNF